MNYDTADLSDPLLKINVKNFGAPKPGTRRPLPPGIKKRRYDKIVPVKTAKKTFEQFMEQVTPKDPEFNKLPVTIDDAITGRIRDLGDADKANKKFRKKTGFNLPLPLAKKKTKVKTA